MNNTLTLTKVWFYTRSQETVDYFIDVARRSGLNITVEIEGRFFKQAKVTMSGKNEPVLKAVAQAAGAIA